MQAMSLTDAVRPPSNELNALRLAGASGDGSFYGYASLFGIADMGGDIVMPGAFRQSLAARGARGVRMLFQHNPGEPIGVWEELRETTRGLLARGRLLPDVARAREVLSLLRAGALDGLSIGFRTVKARGDPRSGARRLLAVDLWEISIVTFPMLPGARVAAIKRTPSPGAIVARVEAGAARLRASTHGRAQ